MADAKRLIASNDKKDQEEGFLALYRSHKCLPKNIDRNEQGFIYFEC